jgi:hypothetical protein
VGAASAPALAGVVLSASGVGVLSKLTAIPMAAILQLPVGRHEATCSDHTSFDLAEANLDYGTSGFRPVLTVEMRPFICSCGQFNIFPSRLLGNANVAASRICLCFGVEWLLVRRRLP